MATALVYDPIYLEHDTGSHPENAGRLVSTMEAIERSGLCAALDMVSPEAATVEEVATVHHRGYIEHVCAIAERGGGFLDPDTYASPGSYEAALVAAGGAKLAMERVLTGEADNAFALVRPPGHHALPNRGMGFCIFNNIAIATRLAQSHHGLDRILIVDFDVHHGNGTQLTFWKDPRVLYFSVHQYPFYPGSGSLTDVGEDAGRGCTINVPLPGGTGDAGYLQTFDEVLEPAARRFRPQFIAVSAGYDLHWSDPIGGMQVTVTGFALMTERLKKLASELCEGRMFFTLEGGYNLEALAQSVVATLQVMADQPYTDKIGAPRWRRAEPEIDRILDRAKDIHGLTD